MCEVRSANCELRIATFESIWDESCGLCAPLSCDEKQRSSLWRERREAGGMMFLGSYLSLPTATTRSPHALPDLAKRLYEALEAERLNASHGRSRKGDGFRAT